MSKEINKIPILINLTEASALLGYSTHLVIRRLINEGFLKSYSLPDSSRTMVNKKEVEDLIQPVEKKENEDQDGGTTLSKK